MPSFKVSMLHTKFCVWFHAIESELELSQEFGKKRNGSATYRDTYAQIATLLFIKMYILYKKIMQFHPPETKFCDPKNSGISDTTTLPFEEFSPKGDRH